MGDPKGRRDLASPFRRLFMTDFYDGPVSGLAVAFNGLVYQFGMVDWDDLHDRRVYSVKLVPGMDGESAERALDPKSEVSSTEWVLPANLSAEGERFLKAAEDASRVEAIVVTRDLLDALELWFPISDCTDNTDFEDWLRESGKLPLESYSEGSPYLSGHQWLERLGFPRHP